MGPVDVQFVSDSQNPAARSVDDLHRNDSDSILRYWFERCSECGVRYRPWSLKVSGVPLILSDDKFWCRDCFRVRLDEKREL